MVVALSVSALILWFSSRNQAGWPVINEDGAGGSVQGRWGIGGDYGTIIGPHRDRGHQGHHQCLLLEDCADVGLKITTPSASGITVKFTAAYLRYGVA